jgi:hypothetical protein
MTAARAELTSEERARRAAVLAADTASSSSVSNHDGHGVSVQVEPKPSRQDAGTEPPPARTPEQSRALRALHGDGGFLSWERVLANAVPANRLSIFNNALAELYPLAERAGVSHTEVADWAMNIGETYDICDTDELQNVIASAARGSREKPAPPELTLVPLRNPVRLRPLNLKDFLQLSIKPRGMLLDPILPEKGLAMLYASRGTGKTHIALGITFAVATGSEFLKWKAPAARRVLLIDGEMPAAALQERLASIVASAPNVEFDPDNIRILAGDLIEGGGIGNLASPDVQAELDQFLDGVALLVLDNLSSLTAVVRDNDAESWGPIQEWLLRLRRRDISVLIVHHAGKGGQQRGTSRREDVLDTSISLRRPADYSPTEGAKFEVHLEKVRGVFGDAAKPFEAKLETRDGIAVWSTRELEDANRARVEALLDDGLSVRDIADETGIPKSTVHRIKKTIQAAGGNTDGP